MLAHSPKDRSRSPQRSNGAATRHSADQSENSSTSKMNKEAELHLRLKSLKTYIQTLRQNLASLGPTNDEQMKALETNCIQEYSDLSEERIRRMIRSIFKSRKSPTSSINPLPHQESTIDPLSNNETNAKKSRSNSISTTKTSDLIPPSPASLTSLEADFLRHAFSQQYRPSIDFSSYFSAAAAAAAAATTPTNGNTSTTPIFRSNYSPSNFLQTLTATPTAVPSHKHLNGNKDVSLSQSNKSLKLSTHEISSVQVLINAYREAASYLSRSADELEQFI